MKFPIFGTALLAITGSLIFTLSSAKSYSDSDLEFRDYPEEHMYGRDGYDAGLSSRDYLDLLDDEDVYGRDYDDAGLSSRDESIEEAEEFLRRWQFAGLDDLEFHYCVSKNGSTVVGNNPFDIGSHLWFKGVEAMKLKDLVAHAAAYLKNPPHGSPPLNKNVTATLDCDGEPCDDDNIFKTSPIIITFAAAPNTTTEER